jgi:hypothetical protein
MAADDAARQRRSRAHRDGDHRQCDVRRCPAARRRGESQLPTPPGGIRRALEQLFAPLRYPVTDPRSLMCEIALQYGDLIDEQGVSPGLTNELRRLISHICEMPNDAADQVDEIRLQAHRKFAMVLLQGGDQAG